MAKHMAVIPPGQQEDHIFTAEVVSKHNNCLRRHIDEAIRIDSEKDTVCNSKSEWGGGALVRLDPTRPREAQRTQPRTNRRNGQTLITEDPGG